MEFTLHRHIAPAEPSSVDQILEAATRVISAHGAEAATFREVSEQAGMTIGGVQHHFKKKEDLLAATSQYVLKQISASIEGAPLPEQDPVGEAGRRLVNVFVEQPHLIHYVSRSLVDKGEVGQVMFRWFYELSLKQGDMFDAQGMLVPGIDRVWAGLNPVILRVGAFVFSDLISEILGEPFNSTAQIHRWEQAIRQLMRHGQINDESLPDSRAN